MEMKRLIQEKAQQKQSKIQSKLMVEITKGVPLKAPTKEKRNRKGRYSREMDGVSSELASIDLVASKIARQRKEDKEYKEKRMTMTPSNLDKLLFQLQNMDLKG